MIICMCWLSTCCNSID